MKKLFVFILALAILSCDNFIKSTSDILSKDDGNKITGRYHTINKENIKVFLPDEFNYISSNEYRNLISRSNDTSIKKREFERLDHIKKSKQNIYFFEYIEAGTIVNVLPTEYISFNKQDAKYMLAIVNNLIKLNSPTGASFEKIAAEFKNNNRTQIFKSIYKYKLPNQKLDFYKHLYFISQNQKSAYITIETPIVTDFDEYIFRTKL